MGGGWSIWEEYKGGGRRLEEETATLRRERRLSPTVMMSLPSKSNIQMQNYIHEIKHANVENLFL